MPYKDLYFNPGLVNENPYYSAISYATKPIATTLLDYGAQQARNYIYSKMPRPLYGVKRKRGAPGPNQGRPAKRMNTNKSGRYIQTKGEYTGPFRLKWKRPKVNKDKYAIKGSRGSEELNVEQATGKDVVYFGITSCPRGQAGKHWMQSPLYHLSFCILKMIFKKYYNVHLENHQDSICDLNIWIDATTDAQSEPARLKLYYKEYNTSINSGGNSVKPTIDVGDTITIGLNNRIRDIAYSIANALGSNKYGAQGPYTSTTIREFYGVGWDELAPAYTQINPNYIYQKRGIERMDLQYCKINCKSIVYIQNQTTSDSGNTSIDVIDSNPIKGRIYYFKDPMPIVRNTYQVPTVLGGPGQPLDTSEWKLMADVDGDGLILPDMEPGYDAAGNRGDTTSPWSQLPTADMFNNLASYTGCSLAPGEMKQFTMKFKFDGLVNDFITGLHQIAGQGNNFFQSRIGARKALGTSVLFAFDKRLSTGTGVVEVAIQKHTYTSAVLTKRKLLTTMPVTSGEVGAATDDTTAPPV